jgi:hypothetical protein
MFDYAEWLNRAGRFCIKVRDLPGTARVDTIHFSPIGCFRAPSFRERYETGCQHTITVNECHDEVDHGRLARAPAALFHAVPGRKVI